MAGEVRACGLDRRMARRGHERCAGRRGHGDRRQPDSRSRRARASRWRCSGRLVVSRAARRYSAWAAAGSPTRSRRWARAAASRWWSTSRSSAASSSRTASPCAGPCDHGDGDGAVERHHRVRGDAGEEVVEPEDLDPVGVVGRGRLVVDGGDGRLQLVRADAPDGQRGAEEGDPLGDQRPVPARPVLLVERDQCAGRARPRRPAGLRQQHQRQQAGDLRLVAAAGRAARGRGGWPPR